VVGGLTGAFVDKFERERSLRSHPPHFFHAAIGAVTNILVALHRNCIDPGKQREALDRVLGTIREQATERLDVIDADTPVFFPDGFDPRAGRRDSDAEYNEQRRRKKGDSSNG
jgi:tRNA U34 5-methylaminomethyl-2-thiouridine-forming methyltransferase MnmC